MFQPEQTKRLNAAQNAKQKLPVRLPVLIATHVHTKCKAPRKDRVNEMIGSKSRIRMLANVSAIKTQN